MCEITNQKFLSIFLKVNRGTILNKNKYTFEEGARVKLLIVMTSPKGSYEGS